MCVFVGRVIEPEEKRCTFLSDTRKDRLMDGIKRYKNKKLLFRENFVQILQETLPNKQLLRKMLHIYRVKKILKKWKTIS